MPGFDGAPHASAVEVYQDKVYDLLAERAPLSVGSSKAGHKVSSSAGKSLIIGNKNAEGRGDSHPKGCRCGECWKKNQAALAERLAKQDSARAMVKSQSGRGGGAASKSSRNGGSADQFATRL